MYFKGGGGGGSGWGGYPKNMKIPQIGSISVKNNDLNDFCFFDVLFLRFVGDMLGMFWGCSGMILR